MEPNTKTLGDHLSALRRRKGSLLGVMLLLLAATVGVAFGLSPVYRSTATILIEQQEIPSELVRSTITTFADQRIQVISQRVMTRANLLDIVKKYNLYPEDQKREPSEVLIENMRKDIKMNMVSADVMDPRSGRPTAATIAFTVGYDNDSPALAQKVANELVSLYLNENLKSREQTTNETSKFFNDETLKLSEQISTLERQLAEFKERNAGQLPELMSLNMQLMDRTGQEITEVDRELRSLKERRIYLESQLAQLDPQSKLFSESGERILGAADRLRVLQAKYVAMAAAYGPDYPDLARMRKEIEALKKEAGEVDTRAELELRLVKVRTDLAVARDKYTEDHPDVKRLEREAAQLETASKVAPGATDADSSPRPDNPAYIQLQAQLQAADAESNSLQKKQNELADKLAKYEQRITRSPQVERKFHELIRDQDNAWAKYKDLKAKQMEAQLSQSLETERKGERFTLIEPPELPEKPLKPNRMAILFLGVMFSFAGGVGTVAVSESMDNTVRGGRVLTALMKLPPLGTIPYIETAEDLRKRRRRRWLLGVTIVVSIVAAVMAVHLLYKPLDVLWYLVQRRMGI